MILTRFFTRIMLRVFVVMLVLVGGLTLITHARPYDDGG